MHKRRIHPDDKKKLLNYLEKKTFILSVEGTKEILASEGIDIKNDYVVALDNSADKEGIEYRIYFNKDDKFENLNLSDNTKLDVKMQKGKIILTKKEKLTELCKKVNDKNLNIDEPYQARGKEW